MYDFDKITDRRDTYSLKWDIAENELPMWVADMDFQTAPEIVQELHKRADNGIFGYTVVPDEWYDAYIGWWGRRHGLQIKKDWLMFCTGVIPAISSIVRKLTTPNENVLLMTPVYNTFYNSIVNNGCRPLECELDYDGSVYSINWKALEHGLSDPQTSLMILCNPQNPIGNIWNKEELAKIGELCLKYHVTVIADEIHCDLTDPGYDYVPFASVSEICRDISITCLAPTKTFNIAGLQTAAVFAADKAIRHKVWRGINTDEVAEPNVFAITAAIAAFIQSEKWLEELRRYLYENKRIVSEYVNKNIPEIKVVPSHATYLLWLDCRGVPNVSDNLADEIRSRTGLYLAAGSHYGKGGAQFLRMNIACPKIMVEDGLRRLKTAIENK